MEFTGEFETHITVNLPNIYGIERLQDWCLDRQLKFLHILLAEGVQVSQPMLTRRGWGDFADELQIATKLATALNRENFPVVRIKIESAPENRGVPQSNSEALTHPADRYFEHHVKLRLESELDLSSLQELVKRHSANLSRNAIRMRLDGFQDRFITQRCMGVGWIDAKKQLQILVAEIESSGYNPIAIESEFVVYDSNLALDSGWICDRV